MKTDCVEFSNGLVVAFDDLTDEQKKVVIAARRSPEKVDEFLKRHTVPAIDAVHEKLTGKTPTEGLIE